MRTDILVVDDEADIRMLIKGILEDEGHGVRLAGSSQEAYNSIQTRIPDVIVLDIWLQGSEKDGMQILDDVQAEHPHIPVLMISGHGNIETAVSAIKQGAYDFIEKPFKSDRLLMMIARALETAALKKENEALKFKTSSVSELLGESQVLEQVKQIAERVAKANSRVLLTGEPGSGKDVLARFIHRCSDRVNDPFVTLNCATLRAEHLEEELFGVQGFEDSRASKSGLLEKADGGFLFLDEVADMPLETQGKIVRVLQEQRFQKIGGNDFIEVDVRVISSTNRDLKEEIRLARFREDLFYRLNVVPIHLPALRERISDIPTLVEHFCKQFSVQAGLGEVHFSKAALKAMSSYGWPGNVRQLRNVVEWVMIMGVQGYESRAIEIEDLPVDIQKVQGHIPKSRKDGIDGFLEFSLRDAREQFERQYLDAQVKRFDGNVSKTAEFIGMERSALHRKIKTLNVLNEDAA